MLQLPILSHREWRLSLVVRVSLLLILTAVLPLTIVAVSSEALARPTLVAQSVSQLETDAQTHAELIESYFIDRLMDLATLTNYLPLQKFMAGNSAFTTEALNTLIMTLPRDANYVSLSVYNLKGKLLLDYPVPPPAAELQFLQPDGRQQLIASQTTGIPPVFFDSASDMTTILFYTPVITAASKALGFLCAVIQLNYVWNVVNSDKGANGDGSYAFVLDQNGVRVADTDPARLLSAIAPLPSAGLHSENKGTNYGKAIPVLADGTLDLVEQSANPPTAFQMVPYGQHETYQVARYSLSSVPWSYFVLSPLVILSSCLYLTCEHHSKVPACRAEVSLKAGVKGFVYD